MRNRISFDKVRHARKVSLFKHTLLLFAALCVRPAMSETIDFTATDGGFTETGSGNWTYVPGTGWQADTPSTVSDNFLTSPMITVSAFSLKQIMQVCLNGVIDSETVATTAFDGEQVRVAINGGAFNTITKFTEGGYNRSISSEFSSPIAGQLAWTGIIDPQHSCFDLLVKSGDTVQIQMRATSDSSSTRAIEWQLSSISWDVKKYQTHKPKMLHYYRLLHKK